MHTSYLGARSFRVISFLLLNAVVAVVFHFTWPARPPVADAAQKSAAPLTEEERIIQIIARASPAVVSIVVQQQGFHALSQKPLIEVGRGTGFLIDGDGLIATNRHVVRVPEAALTVLLADGRSFKAEVAGIDPVNDLALIKIGVKTPSFLQLETDDTYRLGQTTIAIGNALGKYANTVTRGILSGVNRDIEASDSVTGGTERLEELLQTDASINTGNSGGPLLNLQGRVIGMNTAVEHGGRGLGFAIPVSEIRKVIDSYRVYGALARPRLGVRYVAITPELQLERRLAYAYGALVEAEEPGQAPVLPKSPAADAGLMGGDIILEINGKKLEGKLTLAKAIQALRVGDAISMKVARGDAALIVKARLDAHPPHAR